MFTNREVRGGGGGVGVNAKWFVSAVENIYQIEPLHVHSLEIVSNIIKINVAYLYLQFHNLTF